MAQTQGRRRRGRVVAEINVVPYIDVMLVLLVIFMVTAPLINPGQVELPSISKTSAPPVQPLEVAVDKNGNLSLRDRDKGAAERKVTRDELLAAIREKQKRNPEQAVVIAADKEVRYESVLEVMDMLQQNQVQKVGLLARPRN